MATNITITQKTPEQETVIKYFNPPSNTPPSISPRVQGLIWGFVVGLILWIVVIFNADIINGALQIFFLIIFTGGIPAVGYRLGRKMSSSKSNNNMSDEEFNAFVDSKVSKLKERALSTLGINEEQVNEIEPMHLGGYEYDNATYKKKQINGNYVSSHRIDAWIFFSDTQIYFYGYDFHLNKDEKEEGTLEIFYKDITSLSTVTESSKMIFTKTVPGGFMKPPVKKNIAHNVDITMFKLVVSGGRIEIPIENTKENNNKIQAMKQKLREKKST